MKHNTNITTSITHSQIEFNLFTGAFPKKPTHTCKNFGVLKSNGKGIKFAQYSDRAWRDRAKAEKCEACLYSKIYRYCKQIEAETNNNPLADWGYTIIPEIDFKRLQTRIKVNRFNHKHPYKEGSKSGRFRLRYLAFPQPNNQLFLFHNTIELEQSRIIPSNIPKLFLLIKDTINLMPAKSKNRSSRGFGLHYSGNKGYSKKLPEKAIQITFKNPSQVKKLLRKNNVEWVYGEYQIELLSLLELLQQAKIKFYVVKGQDEINSLRIKATVNRDNRVTEILRLLDKGLPIEEDNRLIVEYGELTGKVI